MAVADAAVVPPLLLVGIDGATFDRILPLVRQGRLPVTGSLMERGAWGPLETLEPTVSPAIWTTVATGRLPAEHGILGFDGVPGFTMTTLPTSQMRKVRALWNILSEHGRSVGVVGWWVTWPAEPVDGYIVSDRTAYTRMEATLGADEPRPHEIYPPEIGAEVRTLVRPPNAITDEEVRRFVPLSDGEVDDLIRNREYRHGDMLAEFKYVHQSDRSTADIALHLMRSRATDVTAVAFYGVDTVSHFAWHFMEPERFAGWSIDAADVERFGGLIDHYYEFVDGMLGELIDAAPEGSNVIVFSDHGFGASGPNGTPPWSGGHGRLTPGAPIAPDGILIVSGPSIRAGVRLERPHVLDVAPTVLYLQGLPLAADMPGGVFRESIRDSFADTVPVRQVATFETGPRRRPEGVPLADPELDAAARRRLCALGYVECD
jgi:predicted AlkP superfamily phosphohydrolase/phosphomutase